MYNYEVDISLRYWLAFGFWHCLKSEHLDFRHSLYSNQSIPGHLNKAWVNDSLENNYSKRFRIHFVFQYLNQPKSGCFVLALKQICFSILLILSLFFSFFWYFLLTLSFVFFFLLILSFDTFSLMILSFDTFSLLILSLFWFFF